MNSQDRKSAIDAYRNRKRLMGIFCVTCEATGEVWVGQSRNLEMQQNAIWFALRVCGARFTSMQKAWKEHGESAFSFQTLQQLSEEEVDFPDAPLRAMRARWIEQLRAQPV